MYKLQKEPRLIATKICTYSVRYFYSHLVLLHTSSLEVIPSDDRTIVPLDVSEMVIIDPLLDKLQLEFPVFVQLPNSDEFKSSKTARWKINLIFFVLDFIYTGHR